MEELGKKHENRRLYYDSESTIHLAKKSSFHSNNKNIRIMYHFIQSILEDGHLKLEKIHTSQNLADMLTKGVSMEKLSYCSVSVGIEAWKSEYEKFSTSKKDHSPVDTTMVELMRSASKWEIVGCGA
jgi:hypothetical protein